MYSSETSGFLRTTRLHKTEDRTLQWLYMNVRFGVLTTLTINVTNSWNITPYSQVQVYWRFRRTYYLFQDRKVSRWGKHVLAYFPIEVMCPTERSENVLQTTRRRAPWASILYFRTVHNGSCRGYSIWGDLKISTRPSRQGVTYFRRNWSHAKQLKIETVLNHLVCLTAFPLQFTFWEDTSVWQTPATLSAIFDTVTAQFLRHFLNRLLKTARHSINFLI
jgi:hypothetical protein